MEMGKGAKPMYHQQVLTDEEKLEQANWMVQQISGNHVLDIGCGNGLKPIYLGREGKFVLGIDADTDQIKAANQHLKSEEKEIQQFVTFEQANFFLKEFNSTYDTVMLQHVLEHVADIDTFFTKAASLVSETGKIVIAIPFGKTAAKRTFFLQELLDLQTDEVAMSQLEFFHGWIGVIYERGLDQRMEWSADLQQKLELAFMDKEARYAQVNKDLLHRLEIQQEITAQLEQKLIANNSMQSANDHVKQDYLREKKEKVLLQKELYDTYSEHEATIKKYRALHREYEGLLTRYHNLKNSKLGKLTTKYWQLRRRKRGNK